VIRKINLSTAVAFLFLILSSVSASAESLKEKLNNVSALESAGSYYQALEELGAIQASLSARHAEKMSSFLPEKLKLSQELTCEGEQVRRNSAFGFVNLERIYQCGSHQVKAVLMGGTSSGMGSGVATFGALHRTAARNNPNDEGALRINGKRVMLYDKGIKKSLVYPVTDGCLLTIETMKAKGNIGQAEKSMKPKDVLLSFGKSFDVKGLAAYLESSADSQQKDTQTK
jgi:hypothetical protein